MSDSFDELNKNLYILKTHSQLLKDISVYSGKASKCIEMVGQMAVNPLISIFPDQPDPDKIQTEALMYITMMNTSIQALTDFNEMVRNDKDDKDDKEGK